MMTHDELQAGIWNDERGLPSGTREVALAMAWILHRERTEGDLFPWGRLRELLGHEGIAYTARDGTHRAHWRVHDLIAADAPRYDHGRWAHGSGSCEGPRLRPYRPRRQAWEGRCYVSSHHPHVGECRYPVIYGTAPEPPVRDDKVCGAAGTIKVIERDMVTGWETAHWFCRRHEARAAEVKAQLAARGEPPETIPNRGGLLPRYFAADWAAIYRNACERARGGLVPIRWEPPFHGCDADDWPVPGKTLIPKKPRLAVVANLPA